MTDARFLLVKRGLYYRPDSRGYTGKKSEAGRYHENERCQLEGVDAIHEDDAAEYAPACWMETKLADKDARIAELEARLAHIDEPTPSQWQPIETAPKDGTYILVWRDDQWGDETTHVAHWDDDYWQIHDGKNWHVLRGAEPSRWMPVPAFKKSEVGHE